MLNRKGESMPPCGTPALIGAVSDVDELNWIWECLSVKYNLIIRYSGEGRTFLS